MVRCAAIILTLLLSVQVLLLGQEPPMMEVVKNSEGTEFWMCFMNNFRDQVDNTRARAQGLKLQLFITSSYDAKVTIEIDGIGYKNTIDIRANTVIPIQLPGRAELSQTETPERLAVHITADTAIAVYGLNSRYQTTDTFMGLPITALGTVYRVMGYTKLASDLLSHFSIVATEDGTTVTITPTTATGSGRPKDRPFTVQLRQGDVYTVSALWQSIGPCDLTGTLVMANKPVAVFSGHQCAYVPPKVKSCNHLIEQLPPVTAMGKHYYLGQLKERSKYTFRVVASEDQTRVFKNSKLVAVLKAGEFYEELNVTDHIQVTADKPILVAQFAQGFENGDNVGDPMMILVSPTQQFMNNYRFATPINGEWHHYINVVAPTESIKDVRLNGRRVESSLFKRLGDSRYSIAQVQIPYGTHVIRSEEPFGLYSYGFGYGKDAYDAYGNMAGQSFIELAEIPDSLAPMADGRSRRDDFEVVVRDDRTFDRGLQTVTVVESLYLDADVPKIERGSPLVVLRIRPAVSGRSGRVVLNVVDVAGNTAEYTVCYVFDSRSERYVYVLSTGRDTECVSEDGWLVGAFAVAASHTRMDLEGTSTGELQGQQSFGQAEGYGTGGGIFVGRRVSPSVIFSGRLSLTTMGGSLLSADSTTSAVYDPAGDQQIIYQEGTLLSISAPYLRVGLAAQWFPLRYFYLTAGAQLAMPLGSAVHVRRSILRPTNFDFTSGGQEQTTNPTSLSSLEMLGFEVMGGLGFSYPVSYRVSVFLENTYTHRFNSLASDVTWTTDAIGVNVGAIWRF